MKVPHVSPVLYTIGHSNHDIERFIQLIRSAEIQTLVDVRALPTSRRHPQFEGGRLGRAAANADVAYHWAGRELGGYRSGKSSSVHSALKPAGLRAYADYMDTPEFRAAVSRLIELASKTRVVIMCAEKQPIHCHRSLIADYLTLHGIRVLNIIDVNEIVEHRLNTLVRVEGDRLIYDRTIQGKLNLED